jgi:hypothetical protein
MAICERKTIAIQQVAYQMAVSSVMSATMNGL